MSVAGGRLLYVFNDAGFFLSHRLPVAEAARADGWRVHVATPPGGQEEIVARGFAYLPLPLTRRGANPLREAGALAALARLYRTLRPDLIEHATIKPVLYGGLAARLTRMPGTVSWMTGLGFVFIAGTRRATAARRLIALGYRVALRRPRSRVIFENPDDRGLFVEHGLVAPTQVHLIRGAGVDLRQFLPAPEEPGPPLVVLAGRMLGDKGVREYVAAARMLRAEGLAARFALVGGEDPGNPAGLTCAELEAVQDAGAIEWWGHHTDMPEVFRRAHIVCLPSYREGLPKVLVEAAAAGRAIVATDVPGCREVVRDGWNGLLVPVRDAAALAGALRRLVLDPEERARMGARGRALAEAEFGVERVVTETLAVYRAVAG